MLTDFEKFHLPQKENHPPRTYIDYVTKVSDIIAEPDEDFSHGYFEL